MKSARVSFIAASGLRRPACAVLAGVRQDDAQRRPDPRDRKALGRMRPARMRLIDSDVGFNYCQ